MKKYETEMEKHKTAIKHYHDASTLRMFFRHEFPQVAEIIDNIKTVSYKHLSHRLQRVEGTFVIDTICRKIMKDKPKIPILTIHDSVMTHEEHAPYVKGLILDGLREMGLKVSENAVTIGQ
jgi:hypothetical protein